MRAINHAVTGAGIAFLVPSAEVAIPLAFFSHFICDAIPHHDPPSDKKNDWLNSKIFFIGLILDFLMCVCLVTLFYLYHPYNWALASLCAFLAASPDLLWLKCYISTRQKKLWQPSRFAYLASKIQWFTKPIGGLVEVAWFLAGLAIIIPFL